MIKRPSIQYLTVSIVETHFQCVYQIMRILKFLGNILAKIIGAQWFRVGFGFYLVGLSALLALYFVTSAFVTADIATKGEWYFVIIFVALIISPLAVNLVAASVPCCIA
jgi:hypothetical protein